MVEPYRICPICDTHNHRNASICVICGTTLSEVPLVDGDTTTSSQADSEYAYDFRYGETDLMEDSLRNKGQRYLTFIIMLCIGILGFATLLIIAPGAYQQFTSAIAPATASPTVTPTLLSPATISLATVTIGAPTRTPTPSPTIIPTNTTTPTPEPCIQQVQPGEGLIAVVIRCGHRDRAVLDLVVELNGLNDETDITAGQSIIVPWPTSTLDPNAQENGAEDMSNEVTSLTSDQDEASNATENDNELSADEVALTQEVDPFFRPTPTNPPGITDYYVQAGDNISTIILAYETNIDVLNQLNPEISFSQCDFGTRFGGERCIVLLAPGQRVRVPAPTPTPTLSPTPSGSETATPTATATFNAPNATSPSNRAYFQQDEIVTLRWTTTGLLRLGEAYRVTVENLTTNEVYTADTTNIFFTIPREWQGEEPIRYEYEWTVSVVNIDNEGTPEFTTEPWTFTWEGLSE